MNSNLSEEFRELPEPLRSFQPDWGVVLGSGLGPLVDAIEITASLPFGDVPGLPTSQVPGHAGRFVLGVIGGKRVLIAQGRVHLYEGLTARAATTFVRCMAALGTRRIILTNAAGTLNRDFAPGSWMMLRDHLNLTGTSPLLGGPNFVDLSEVYSAKLRAHFGTVAAEQGMPLHEGIYAGLLGPQYETPAEIRMLGTLGADAVGMSTVLEAIQARALGLEVAAFSCLTNWAAGLQAELSHEEVLATGRQAGAVLARLLVEALPRLSPRPAN
jgi:purine-nucleoside phosphorylase